MTFKIAPLPYAFDALEPHIDAETMHLHYEKHFAAYIKKYNAAIAGTEFESMDVDEVLQQLEKVPQDIRNAIRNNGGGVSNHAKFWEWMTPESTNPSGGLLDAIQKQYSDFNSFQAAFSDAALARFGSGWVWLILKDGSLDIITTPNQDTPISDGITPLLGLDVWEHGYYRKFGPARAAYVDAWWNVVNWNKVNELFGGME